MNQPSPPASLEFWMAEAAGAEERARAEGHQIQSCLGLGVSVVAGGLITAGIGVLDVPVVSGLVAFAIWLLALVGCLHWSEMTAFAAKRTVAEAHIEKRLPRTDATVYRALLDDSRFGQFWWTGLAATILICACAFGGAFIVAMTQATSGAPDVQGFLVGGATVAAVATVGLAVLSGLRRRTAIYRHMP